MWDPQGAASMTTSSEPLWRPSRRTFLNTFALSAAVAGPLFGRTPSAAAVTKSELVYVSSWRGVNLHGFWFDPAGGIMTPIGPVAGTSVVVDTGSGPHPRQQGPHPHHVAVAAGGKFALVADF